MRRGLPWAGHDTTGHGGAPLFPAHWAPAELLACRGRVIGHQVEPGNGSPVARTTVRALAVLSMHTSPLVQPGTGDGGGMNVYVRELSSALARSGVNCEVFTRAEDPNRTGIVSVEPGFRVHHIAAGPVGPVAKERLPELVPEWTDR